MAELLANPKVDLVRADETGAPAVAADARPTVRLSAHSVPRWAVIGIFLLLLIAAIGYARVFLMPVLLAFLLALVFSPVRRFMSRRGLPAGLSALVIVGTLLAALTVGAVVLADPVRGWIDSAPDIGRTLETKVRSLLGSAQAVVEAGKQVNEIATGGQSEDVQEVVVREPGFLSTFAFQAPAMVAQIAFTLVLLLFLLSSGDMFYEKLVHVMPTFKDKRRAMRIAYDIERKLSRYLFTITLINAGLGIAIGLAMWAIGMPNPLLFGVVAFAFNYAPYLGALCGLAITSIVGLMTFDQLGHALLPGSAYFALTAVEGQFITPYFVGRRLEMNTVVIFLSIAFWAWLWSVIGMLVAVPLLVMVRAFCEHIPKLEPVGDFLSVRGGELPDEEDGTDRT
jgi:predicted PurR-regulated permease PerM